ncbi:MAG: alanine/ornithine racemase family PLP-dependent enzyme [Synergistaceae bacterium]|jgi:predicted amino acid racemase|nr:alanine/ornithine racemase family PLP-dependent enzyme [Synergistaceae bacterium]
MCWPKLVAHLGRIAENASKVVEFCASAGVTVAAVTKGVCSDLRVAGAMIEGGCASFGDSRVQNLACLKKEFPRIPRTLLRIPMKSELEDVVQFTDSSLVSMTESIEALEARCLRLGATHKVILMFDLGDRREGIFSEEIEAFVEVLRRTSHVALQGVGVNFGCFAGVLPSAAALRRLCSAREALEKELGYSVPVCSGGATSSLALLERGELPPGVNQLRVGEAILLGQDVTWQRTIPWLRHDTIYLEAEVVETRFKSSLPEGETGRDAFGKSRTFEDKGKRRRAIVAVGRQDAPVEGLVPWDPGLQVLGGSSDHTILDVTDAEEPPRWGDALRFSVDYAAMLGLMTSPYVFKEYR